MNLSIILFDFDGTIADTFTETVEIFNHFAHKYGYKQIRDKDIEMARHMNVWQLLKYVEIPKHKVPFLLRKGRAMLYKNLDKIQVFDGVREILKWAESNGIPCGVITSNSKKNVERFVQINSLPNIHFVRSSSRIMGKPREFKRILKKRKIRKEQVVYIGDEGRDIEASQATNIPVISVSWGYNSRDSLKALKPDFIADTPNDLLGILKEINASSETLEPQAS